MKDNILITISVSISICFASFVVSEVYKNFKSKTTVEERIEQCRKLGMKSISVGLYDTYDSVNCRDD